MNFDITHDGRTTLNVDRETALALNYPAAAINDAQAHATAIAGRDVLRSTIFQSAGDRDSILGTTTDGAQMIIVDFATYMRAASKATTIAAMAAAAKPFADKYGPLLDKIEEGDVRFPYQLKGDDVVLDDIETRSTAVADALIAISITAPQ